MVSSEVASSFQRWRTTRERPAPRTRSAMPADVAFILECYAKAIAFQVDRFVDDNLDDPEKTILRLWSDDYHDGLHLFRSYGAVVREIGEYYGMKKLDICRFIIDTVRNKLASDGQ